MSEQLSIPDHIPDELVRDIDPYNLDGAHQDAICAWAKVQKESPDIFYMPRYSGYWIVTRKALFDQILEDPDTFSSERQAIFPPLPPEAPLFKPLQSDAPEHRFFRQPFNLLLGPKNVPALAQRAREVVNECIDRFYDKGECEFMQDVAMHVPVTIVMQVFNLPYSDRERLLPLVDVITHCEDLEKRAVALHGVATYADEWVTRREQEPGEDAISALLKINVGDRPVTHEEVTATVTLLLLGGLDSVSHTMGAIMRFLAENPDHQRQIAENPDIMPQALDELLRRHAISITTRVAKRDIELAGAHIKKGDKVMLSLPLAATDEHAWPNAMDVDFNRRPRGYLNFGTGIHKCVGLNLARAELLALLQEWFKRIPSFSIKSGDKAVTTSGNIQGVMHLPLSWPVS